jgi:anti-anti-sigma factor
MRFLARSVTVTQLPEAMQMKQGRHLLRELKSCMNNDRPCMVLDCSKLRQIDGITLHVLLCCLEEAMKRNGDVILAAVTASARDTLDLARVDRLFEIYDTETEAVDSVFQPHRGPMP